MFVQLSPSRIPFSLNRKYFNHGIFALFFLGKYINILSWPSTTICQHHLIICLKNDGVSKKRNKKTFSKHEKSWVEVYYAVSTLLKDNAQAFKDFPFYKRGTLDEKHWRIKKQIHFKTDCDASLFHQERCSEIYKVFSFPSPYMWNQISFPRRCRPIQLLFSAKNLFSIFQVWQCVGCESSHCLHWSWMFAWETKVHKDIPSSTAFRSVLCPKG